MRFLFMRRADRRADPFGYEVEEQGITKHGKHSQGGDAAILVDADGPAATNGDWRGEHGEGERHAHQHEQSIALERAVSPGEHERQHRQDAGIKNGQCTRQIGEDW
jgi:hypothetical protein